MKWQDWLEVVGDGIIIVFGIWSAFTFIMMLTHGLVIYVEPIKPILITELVLAILAFGFGIERLINDIGGM